MGNKPVDLDVITGLLAGTKIETVESGVSFAGKSLKLDKEEDASEVVKAILDCKNLCYLNLEGNTLGVDAAKGIGKALESHPEFKRALWKDMFTGRMKEEIPEALRFLGSGLMLSNANLLELDLSDNAFGPIGVEGLASLLKSKCCFALEILRLNNNGLGITGGKLLASALMSCYNSSKDLGKPLALKVFIAGRNRLENEGAKALSQVFSTLKSLEEIRMPQNGIYHVGITALADAFSVNKNLKILDLNDNTVSEKGSIALANVLPNLQSLTHLNLGDCLLKTAGALAIAKSLNDGHENLQEVNFSCNEIRLNGGLALAEALLSKDQLTSVILDGNQFGDEGVSEVHERLSSCETATISIEDDEGDEDDDEDEDIEEDDEEEEEAESENSEPEEIQSNKSITENLNVQKSNISVTKSSSPSNSTQVTVSEFLKTPTVNNFLSLGSTRNSLILDEVKKAPESDYLETMLSAIMKVSALVGSGSQVDKPALTCSEYLYQDLCNWSKTKNDFSLVSNTLLVHLGLMKSEDKAFKVTYNTHGCKAALQQAMTQNYFPNQIKDTMQFFLSKK